jgi:hypothetical protein
MTAYNRAIETMLRQLCDQAIAALDGMPEEAMAAWKPGQAHGDVSTMYGLATHIAGAGEFWTLEAVGGADLQRRRLEEFAASGSIAALRDRYDRWLEALHDLLEGLTEEDLRSVYRREANPAQGISAAERPRAECIIHAVEHTALHVGHLQIQRQLWDQEQLSHQR